MFDSVIGVVPGELLGGFAGTAPSRKWLSGRQPRISRKRYGIFVELHCIVERDIVAGAVTIIVVNAVGRQHAPPLRLDLCASEDQEVADVVTEDGEISVRRLNGLTNALELSGQRRQLTLSNGDKR